MMWDNQCYAVCKCALFLLILCIQDSLTATLVHEQQYINHNKPSGFTNKHFQGDKSAIPGSKPRVKQSYDEMQKRTKLATTSNDGLSGESKEFLEKLILSVEKQVEEKWQKVNNKIQSEINRLILDKPEQMVNDGASGEDTALKHVAPGDEPKGEDRAAKIDTQYQTMPNTASQQKDEEQELQAIASKKRLQTPRKNSQDLSVNQYHKIQPYHKNLRMSK